MALRRACMPALIIGAATIVSLSKDYQGYKRNIKCIDHPLTVATVVIIRSYKMTAAVATKYQWV